MEDDDKYHEDVFQQMREIYEFLDGKNANVCISAMLYIVAETSIFDNVPFEKVSAYLEKAWKHCLDAKANKALTGLVEQAQELDMGY